MVYKYNEDEEEFYLASFDEMHNHMLVPDPGIIPFVKKQQRRPIFPTPMFFKFQNFKAADFEDFQNQLQQTARERCFEIHFAGEFGENRKKESIALLRKTTKI